MSIIGTKVGRGFLSNTIVLDGVESHWYGVCNKSSAVAEMGDRLAIIDMGQKERTGCSSALEYPNGLFLSLA